MSQGDAGERGYSCYKASGSARELGREHGAQAATQIRGFLDYLARSLDLTSARLRERALQFRPLFAAACPALLEEIDGLAEGERIAPAEALAVQIRGELAGVADGGCTSFVIGREGTADGAVLIGQTSDMPAEIEAFAYVLHLAPFDRPELLMWTFGGMIGYHGLNAHGVAHFANSLGGGPAWRFALPHYPLKRLLLERECLADAVAVTRSLPVCSNGNYVLCDGQGKLVDIELTTDGPQLLDDSGEGFLVHSNHFLCGAHACEQNFQKSLPDSFPRLHRLREQIASRFGRITPADMQALLSDHAGYPTSICRHPHDGPGDAILPSSGRTVAAIIAQPESGRLHISRGNPCQNPFVEYRLSRPPVPADRTACRGSS